MNIENFKLLRDHVANNSKFDMGRVTHPCGSAACIMGSAEALILSEMKDAFTSEFTYYSLDGRLYVDQYYIRAKWLDISTHEFDHLHMGLFSAEHDMNFITQEEAVAFLNKCIEEGYVCTDRPHGVNHGY